MYTKQAYPQTLHWFSLSNNIPLQGETTVSFTHSSLDGRTRSFRFGVMMNRTITDIGTPVFISCQLLVFKYYM